MLLREDIYNTLSSIEKISPRIMTATFQGNPQTTIITCYSPTNVSDETETERFYAYLSSLNRQIPKHNILIISGDFNAQIGQNDNGNFHLLLPSEYKQKWKYADKLYTRE